MLSVNIEAQGKPMLIGKYANTNWKCTKRYLFIQFREIQLKKKT